MIPLCPLEFESIVEKARSTWFPFLSFTAFDDDAQRNSFLRRLEFHRSEGSAARRGTSSWMEWYCSSITPSACSSIHIQRSIWRYFCLQRARFTITSGYMQISFPARDYRCLPIDEFRANETVEFNSVLFSFRDIKRRSRMLNRGNFVSFRFKIFICRLVKLNTKR